MRRDLLDLLCCPVCRGTLALTAKEERDSQIWTGMLTCQQCRETYPIEDGIPDLLPPSSRP